MATQVSERSIYIGWQVATPLETSTLQKISALVAYALFWIASLFSQNTAQLLQAFRADAAQNNKEIDRNYISGLPDHNSLENMRLALLSLIGKTDIDIHIQAVGWVKLDDNLEAQLKRMKVPPAKMKAVADASKAAVEQGHLDALHSSFLALRTAIRTYGSDPVRQIMSCFREDQELEYALSIFKTEITALETIFAEKKDLTGFDASTHLQASLEKLEAALILWGVSSSAAPSPRSGVRVHA
jgi:hypothetical protein